MSESKKQLRQLSEDHRTNECPNPEAPLLHFLPRITTHTSWDRNCPNIRKRAAQIDENPEHAEVLPNR